MHCPTVWTNRFSSIGKDWEDFTLQRFNRNLNGHFSAVEENSELRFFCIDGDRIVSQSVSQSVSVSVSQCRVSE
jgi:hypothetical protein